MYFNKYFTWDNSKAVCLDNEQSGLIVQVQYALEIKFPGV